MPVILMPDDYDRWLDRDTPIEAARAMLKPYDAELMKAYAVSRTVNSVKNDTEECIEPMPTSRRSARATTASCKGGAFLGIHLVPARPVAGWHKCRNPLRPRIQTGMTLLDHRYRRSNSGRIFGRARDQNRTVSRAAPLHAVHGVLSAGRPQSAVHRLVASRRPAIHSPRQAMVGNSNRMSRRDVLQIACARRARSGSTTCTVNEAD